MVTRTEALGRQRVRCVGWSKRCVQSCFFALAAARDVCCLGPLLPRWRVACQRFGRRPVRYAVRRNPEAAGAAVVLARQLFRRSFGLNQQPPQPAPTQRVAGSRACVLRAKLRRQVFSADHARQCLAGAALSGVLPGQCHQGIFRRQHRQRGGGHGERYADSENAYAYRKALRADCTCNGRSPSGLAPVDLTLDTSLRSGDVIATTDGLVAYTGVRLGSELSAEFTPVASFPGLTADVRARLGEMKVAPVSAEMVADR